MNKEDMVAMYKRFKKWCDDSPYLDLDPRLHTHSGPIGDGGYISHEKTRVAFAAWRAALEAAQAEVERPATALRELEEREQRDEALLRQALTALKDIRSLSSISSAINQNPCALTALLAGIHHIADTALAQEDRND